MKYKVPFLKSYCCKTKTINELSCSELKQEIDLKGPKIVIFALDGQIMHHIYRWLGIEML